jgi:hypothetical protein
MAGSVNPGEWIIEDYASGLITRFTQSSAVMGASGRTEPMRTNQKWIAKDTDADVEVTQKGSTYNLDDEGMDKIEIHAAKLTHASSYDEEDRADAAAWQNVTDAKKRRATSNLAVLYDNLALGVTGAQVVNSKTAPYESVYHAVATDAPGNLVTVSLAAIAAETASTSGKTLWGKLNEVLEIAEDSDWAGEDLVWVISQNFKGKLRAMDATGKNGVNFYVPPTGGDPGSRVDKGVHLLRGNIGGYPAYFSKGARLSAAGTAAPTTGVGAKGALGNAIGVLVPASYLIVGNRSPLESQFLDSQNGNGGVGALSDTDYLKMRMRKGFKLAEASAAAVIEIIT